MAEYAKRAPLDTPTDRERAESRAPVCDPQRRAWLRVGDPRWQRQDAPGVTGVQPWFHRFRFLLPQRVLLKSA